MANVEKQCVCEWPVVGEPSLDYVSTFVAECTPTHAVIDVTLRCRNCNGHRKGHERIEGVRLSAYQDFTGRLLAG